MTAIKKQMLKQGVKRIGWLMIAWLFVMSAASVKAEIKYIDLTNPFMRKIPMAVPQFQALTGSADELALARSLADQFSDMIKFTGYFVLLDRSSFLFDPQRSGITESEINFGNWIAVGTELLVTGGVRIRGQELSAEFRLFDTFKKTLVIGKRYSGGLSDQRAILRRFCTDVIQALTGQPGFFNSRLAFVSTGTGHKEIYLCDFDGANVQQLTNKKSITSYPDWSWDDRYLAFISYEKGPVQIYVHHLSSGAETSFNFKGVQIAPSWSPNRFELGATLSMGGNQEIYLLTGEGKIIKRLTNSPEIDVELTWAPDGKRVAFVSKRAGTPQIYIMEVASGRISRLTFEGRYNTQPAWSPKGDKIAYSTMKDGHIDIAVIDVEGKYPIQLTRNQGDNEAPSWSPDGSLIAFSSTREGKSRIFIMTAFGTDPRRLLILPGDQSHPVWSHNTLK